MPRNRWIQLAGLIMIATIILLACVPIQPDEAPAPPAAAVETGSNQAVTADTDSGDTDAQALASGNAGVPQLSGELIADGVPAPFRTSGFSTDFSRRTVEWSSILSGGPPKDGIPAVDSPQYESIAAGDEWLEDQEPVILFSHGDVARAYPLGILIWHEIVNDELDGVPVSITFCPLCNASIAFDRNFDGQVLDFGTTGRLRNSDLIMYDRQTETWWQQFTGEGIIGKYAGEQLNFLSSQVLSWGDFKVAHPDGDVLARPNMPRNYGYNPYVGYDSTSRPFLFLGTPDSRLEPAERVLGLTTKTDAIAYPFAALEEAGVVHDSFGGAELAIFHKAGLASALDTAVISSGPRHRYRSRLRTPTWGSTPDLLCQRGWHLQRRRNRQHLGHSGRSHRWPPGRREVDPCTPFRSLLVCVGGLLPGNRALQPELSLVVSGQWSADSLAAGRWY